jgi:hypothetical protein
MQASFGIARDSLLLQLFPRHVGNARCGPATPGKVYLTDKAACRIWEYLDLGYTHSDLVVGQVDAGLMHAG